MSPSLSSSSPTQARIIGLVSIAHFYSHFMGLVLPPLFPVLMPEFGLTNLELGTLIAMYAATTGLGQIPFGFLVDRFGGRPVLIGGLGLGGGSLVLMSGAGAYWQLLVLMGLTGFANSAFHPADYAILADRIDDSRMGRAVSIHGFSGYLGWAAAPIAMLALSEIANWRTAIGIAGVAGLAVAAILVWQGGAIGTAAPAGGEKPSGKSGWRRGIGLMRSRPMQMMFLFFLLNSITVAGLTSFAVLAVMGLYGVGAEVANYVLTGFLCGMAVGVLCGGWLADRFRRPNLVASLAIAGAALFIAIAAPGMIPVLAGFAAMAAGGFLIGLTSPSRDLLVRAATPPGAIGVAFGFTSTGMAIGYAIGPVLCGQIMDSGRPDLALLFLAAVLAFSILPIVAIRSARRG